MPDPLAMTPDVVELAEALQGQYAFDGEIGRGGMGVVYRATDVKLDRPVAIKVLPPYLERDPAIRERFLREARTSGSLSHPTANPWAPDSSTAGRSRIRPWSRYSSTSPARSTTRTKSFTGMSNPRTS